MHGHAWQATNNTISPIVYKFEPILISYFYYVMPVQTYRLAMEEPHWDASFLWVFSSLYLVSFFINPSYFLLYSWLRVVEYSGLLRRQEHLKKAIGNVLCVWIA